MVLIIENLHTNNKKTHRTYKIIFVHLFDTQEFMLLITHKIPSYCPYHHITSLIKRSLDNK